MQIHTLHNGLRQSRKAILSRATEHHSKRTSNALLGDAQVRLFTNWRLTAATKQRTPDDADLCSLCALKMLLADQEVCAVTSGGAP